MPSGLRVDWCAVGHNIRGSWHPQGWSPGSWVKLGGCHFHLPWALSMFWASAQGNFPVKIENPYEGGNCTLNLCKGSHHIKSWLSVDIVHKVGWGYEHFCKFWGDFVIYMEIIERIYSVCFQWKASLPEEDEIIDIWCHHPPSISSLLGPKKKVNTLVTIESWGG